MTARYPVDRGKTFVLYREAPWSFGQKWTVWGPDGPIADFNSELEAASFTRDCRKLMAAANFMSDKSLMMRGKPRDG